VATGRITDHRRHDAGQLHRVTFPSDIPRDATLQKVCVAEGFRQNVTSDVTRFFSNVLAKKTSRNLRIVRELAERVGVFESALRNGPEIIPMLDKAFEINNFGFARSRAGRAPGHVCRQLGRQRSHLLHLEEEIRPPGRQRVAEAAIARGTRMRG
jgi:hypothetical protein